jgi:hypothetical protein
MFMNNTEKRTTKALIVNPQDLEENQVFVFGSNLAGKHGKGAALTAVRFGAKYGKGIGHHGNTYAIPTKDENLKTLSLNEISKYVSAFLDYCVCTPEKVFVVTQVGCGLAGYTCDDIAPMFKDAIDIENIHLPTQFWEVIWDKE